MKKLLVFILIFMLAFTGCDKFHKTINGLQDVLNIKEALNDEPGIKKTVQDKPEVKEVLNDKTHIKEIVQDKPEVKEVLNDKTNVKEVGKAEHHHTVGDGLYLAVKMGMGYLFAKLFIGTLFVCFPLLCLAHEEHQQ